MNDIGGVRKEGSILVLLLGDPRYMHGLVKCTCFHKYVILHPGNFHGLINIWFVGAPHQMIPTFSMFQDEMELDNFPRKQKEYKYMENIMVFNRWQTIGVVLVMVSCQQKKLVSCIDWS